MGGVRECLIADRPNLLTPSGMRPMRFRALRDCQGKEVVDAGWLAFGPVLDDQRFAFGVRGAGVIERPHNDAADGRRNVDFCAMKNSLVGCTKHPAGVGGIIGNKLLATPMG